MSFKDIPSETLRALANAAKALGATGFHVAPIRVCDHCQDDGREAFPYYATDKDGREWVHLCNVCFDLLECYWPDGGLTTGKQEQQ